MKLIVFQKLRQITLFFISLISILILLGVVFNPQSAVEAAPPCNTLNDCWRFKPYYCFVNGQYCQGWRCDNSLTPECSWPWGGQCPFGPCNP